jgi:hypothetical protein
MSPKMVLEMDYLYKSISRCGWCFQPHLKIPPFSKVVGKPYHF